MIWNLSFSFWVGSISPAFGFPRSSVVHPSHLSCLGSQQAGTRHESVSPPPPCARHLQSPGASSGRVPQRRSSARRKAVCQYAALRNSSCLVLTARLHCCDEKGKPLLSVGVVRAVRRRRRRLAAARAAGLPGAAAAGPAPQPPAPGTDCAPHRAVSPPMALGDGPSSTWQ